MMLVDSDPPSPRASEIGVGLEVEPSLVVLQSDGEEEAESSSEKPTEINDTREENNEQAYDDIAQDTYRQRRRSREFWSATE